MNRYFQYIFQADEKRLDRFLHSFLSNAYGAENIVYSQGKYIVAKGNINVALVAHLDTVHNKSNRGKVFVDREKGVAWSPMGLGSDDRAGVYSIFEIIRDGYRPHIIFTHDEEIGCIGAKALAKDHTIESLGIKLNYMVELDRDGAGHGVFYQCDNKSFKDFISSFGLKEEIGSNSDIVSLSSAWDVASVNLACGGRNQHTTSEYLTFSDMYDTIDIVESMLDNATENPEVSYKLEKKVYVTTTHYDYSYQKSIKDKEDKFYSNSPYYIWSETLGKWTYEAPDMNINDSECLFYKNNANYEWDDDRMIWRYFWQGQSSWR